MKLFVTTHYPQHDGTHMLDWIKASAAADVHRKHQLWDDPETADAILFFEGHAGTDPLRLGILFNPIYRKYKDKCFLYQDGDYAYPFMRGLYPSLLKEHHRPGWCEGAPYFARQAVNDAVTAAVDLNPERKWLASFVGANNCAVRTTILSWKHPQIYVQDTTGKHAWQMPAEDRKRYEASYAQVCAESQAILAPRGLGPSTYRLYEAMEIGRCPIILSDDWIPPPHIDWGGCSVRLSESNANDAKEIVNAISMENIDEKGSRAAEIFKQAIDTPHAWHYIATQMEALAGTTRGKTSNLTAFSKALKSSHGSIVLGSILRSLRKGGRMFS